MYILKKINSCKYLDNYKLNNQGFTLIEMLAVVSIIAILGLLVVPGTLNTINKSTETAYDILVKDITVASKLLFEELSYSKANLYHYTKELGKTDNKIKLELDEDDNKIITVNLQTLVSNGLLSGVNNSSVQDNINNKILINPKTNEDIGDCQITIVKEVNKDNNYIVSYQMKNNSVSMAKCPIDEDYQEALN